MRRVDTWRGDETITVADAIAGLNRILATDPLPLAMLLNQRAVISARLSADPFLRGVKTETGHRAVNYLGVLNSLFGVDASDRGPIQADANLSSGGHVHSVSTFRLVAPAAAAPPPLAPDHDPTHELGSDQSVGASETPTPELAWCPDCSAVVAMKAEDFLPTLQGDDRYESADVCCPAGHVLISFFRPATTATSGEHES